MLISHTKNCASGVIRKSVCVITYIIVCWYDCLLLLLLVVVLLVLCLQYNFASDKPPPSQIIAVSVGL